MCGTQVRFLAWPIHYLAGVKVDRLANGPATHMSSIDVEFTLVGILNIREVVMVDGRCPTGK